MRQPSKDQRVTPLPLLHLLILGFDIDNSKSKTCDGPDELDRANPRASARESWAI
jgi:hypothetical protein